jgi:hypothetical protein
VAPVDVDLLLARADRDQLCRQLVNAEDVAQWTLLKAAQHLDGFRWEASVRIWPQWIATNECHMFRPRKLPASLTRPSGPWPLARAPGSTLPTVRGLAYLIFLLARSRLVLVGAARSRCQGWPEATRRGPPVRFRTG